LGAEALEMAASGGVASLGRKSAAYPRLQKTEMRPPDLDADHGGCVQPAFLQVKAWFDSLKQ
jgi:hypothetical protein